jgi:hypothetical protein
MMAEEQDSRRVRGPLEIREWPIASALREGMHLRARCANPHCERVAVFDASWWARGHSPGDRISMLERRMRCSVCGAREAGLEIWSGPQPSPSGRGPYLFC